MRNFALSAPKASALIPLVNTQGAKLSVRMALAAAMERLDMSPPGCARHPIRTSTPWVVQSDRAYGAQIGMPLARLVQAGIWRQKPRVLAAHDARAAGD